MAHTILLVDDERELLESMTRALEREGFSVHTALSGEEGVEALSGTAFDLVVTDMSMPGMSGIELLKRARAADPLLPVVIMTGVGTIETAVNAIQWGAYDYITKPFTPPAFMQLVSRAIEHGLLHRRLDPVRNRETEGEPETMIMGNNIIIQQMMATLDKVSLSDAPILIRGETGTGKSLFAKRIHRASSRADHPFFTIDCSTLNEQLLESELFGHVRGAFTGAVRTRQGLLEEAQGGTIFLDEIGELSPQTQVKLLRAIQEKEIKPVGGNRPISIDVRFLAATSRDLDQEVEHGRFRKDLYYRLAVIPVHIPPLRERLDDLVLFVAHFLGKYGRRYGKSVTSIAPAAMQVLLQAPWEGNIRELENVLERAVLLTDGETILPSVFASHWGAMPAAHSDASSLPLRTAVEQAEASAIRNALKATNGNRSRAAQLLAIGRTTLYEKIEAYRIK